MSEEQDGQVSSDTVVDTFDFSKMEADSKGKLVRQEGNFLLWESDKGTKFRTQIPHDKILDKKDGEWILKDREIIQAS